MLCEVVDDAGDERGLRPGDEKIDTLFFGEGNEACKIGIFDCRDIGDFAWIQCRGASIARDYVYVLDRWRMKQFPGNGMFAATVADE